MKPTDFMSLGQQILRSNITPDEAKLRTVVGRFYYAAFLESRDRLVTRHPDIAALIKNKKKRGLVHQTVIDKLKMNPKMALAGNMLFDLRGLRNQADYDIHITHDWIQSTSDADKWATHIVKMVAAEYP